MRVIIPKVGRSAACHPLAAAPSWGRAGLAEGVADLQVHQQLDDVKIEKSERYGVFAGVLLAESKRPLGDNARA